MIKIITPNIPMVKLTNGTKTIERSKIQYEANLKHFTMRGFKLVSDKVKEVKKVNDKVIAKAKNVVKLKPKGKGKKK
tara:strand:+ start:846 stop:1076 length:231 start_codon:yes stop_codon:yes gene_type:complete